jgi:hypothetical protein
MEQALGPRPAPSDDDLLRVPLEPFGYQNLSRSEIPVRDLTATGSEVRPRAGLLVANAADTPVPRGRAGFQNSSFLVRQVAAGPAGDRAADPRDRPDFRTSDGQSFSARSHADSPPVMAEK